MMDRFGPCKICGKETTIGTFMLVSELAIHPSTDGTGIPYETIVPGETLDGVCMDCGNAWGENARKEYDAKH